MSDWTSVYLGSGGVNPTTAGTEIPQARRQIDFSDVQYVRFGYAGGGLLGDVGLGINYSTDFGATWNVMIPKQANLGIANYVYSNPWLDVNANFGNLGDCWITAIAYGTALLGGLLYPIAFMELQLR